ncbi:hypothetical protein F5X68DRAFT_39554 [Plectosphaerella plurivora]|uniref:Uncharacterized protein n=1 Tax=Plectosphaerella plurivora TaxID=936078 RepID=A0A9P9A825_9PEZI|nr:hypothetical protein F5X68DRAFT_39554 [Plectosphaerella plurivora]
MRRTPPPKNTTTEEHHHRRTPPPKNTTTEEHHHRRTPPPKNNHTSIYTTDNLSYIPLTMSFEDRISSPLIPDLKDVTVTTRIHGVGMTDFRDPPPLMASSSGAGTERGPSTHKGKERETSPDRGEKRGTVNKDDVFEPGGRDRHGLPPRYIPPALQPSPKPSRDLLCRTPKCPSGRASPSRRQGLPASPPARARARIAAKPSCQRRLAASLASPATPVAAPPKILPQTPGSRQTIRSNRRKRCPASPPLTNRTPALIGSRAGDLVSVASLEPTRETTNSPCEVEGGSELQRHRVPRVPGRHRDASTEQIGSQSRHDAETWPLLRTEVREDLHGSSQEHDLHGSEEEAREDLHDWGRRLPLRPFP